MSIRFVPLLKLTVTHGFYAGRCPDFAYVLPSDAQGLLRNGRMFSATRDGELLLLFEANDAGSPLVRLDGRTIRIGLVSLNPWLGNVTAALPVTAAALYANDANPLALQGPTAVQLVSPLFGHPLQDTARPVTITLRDSAGVALRTETVTGDDPRTALSVDLRGVVVGRIGVEELYPANVLKSSVYYVDAELRQQGVTIVVEARVDGSFYTTTADLTLGFDARQETLKYYIVARKYSDADVGQLTVKDAGFTDEARPEIKFTKVAAASFTPAELPAAVLAGSDAKLVLFKSQSPVSRRATPRKGIQLQRNSDVLILHLPPPSPANATADMVVHVAKP